jgi:hypothetical protein
MPAGTKYADYANCHNYLSNSSFSAPKDNQTWRAADPSASCPVDGLFKHYGKTWNKGYKGYPEAEIVNLPRVTTETGTTISGNVTEELQALLYTSVYLAQFKRGYEYTCIYILRDRSDESNNQSFGFFDKFYTPRLSAHYLHNLTSILKDSILFDNPGELSYSIPNTPITVHDLLLQRSDGKFQLIIWSEKFGEEGSDNITVEFSKLYDEIKVYNPVTGTEPIQTLKNVKSLPLTMTNHPYVIELAGEFGTALTPATQEKQRTVFVDKQQQLHIEKTRGVKRMELIDLTGKCLWQANNIEARQTTVDLQPYNKGIYLVRIVNADHSFETHKIVR